MIAFTYHGFYSFGPHIAVFLGLIALGFGYWICLKSQQDAKCPKWGKFIGILISLAAALGLFCVLYLTLKRCCLAQKGDWHKSHLHRMMPDSGEHPAEEK